MTEAPLTTTPGLPPIDELGADCILVQPIDIDWTEAKGEDMDGWEYWEAFNYTVERPEDRPDVNVVMIANESSVVAVFVDGHRIDLNGDLDDAKIACIVCDAECSVDGVECMTCDGCGWVFPGGLHVEEVEALQFVEPYENGAEGPMMNYYYGLDTSRSTYGSSGLIGGYHGRSDEIDTAYKLRDVSLCLVCVDEEYALALTGGGMDMTWSIVEAFCRLNLLPPIKYCTPPGFSDRDEVYLKAAMRQSLITARDRVTRDLDRLDEA